MNKIIYIIFIIFFIILIIKIIYYLYSKLYSKKNKIAVCTWYDDNIKEYADITSEINQKYCDKNNYDYIVDHTRRLKDRHPAWERFALFTKLFKNYDYVVWIDADACFRYDHPNQSLLRDIIHKNKDKDIIFSYDHPRDPNQINSGFIIMKNTEYSKQFCNEIIHNKNQRCTSHYNNPYWEQECVRYLHNNNINSLKEKSIILPFELLQTFSIDENKDSLIIHMAGHSKETRIDIFKKLNENYKIL
jgi:hypothetical protein